jgi:hypothetical protein
MKCDIQWNSLSLPEWEERFAQIKRSNFLQSYVYAQGACQHYRQKVRWGLLLIDGKEAGLVQLFEAGFLFNLFHAVIIDRGPLWFDGYGHAAHVQAFLKEFQAQFPKRIGRKRRILPEIDGGLAANALIKQVGLEKLEEKEPYETYWLDLLKNKQDLRVNLDGKWRNSLKKAEEANLTIEWDEKGALYPWIRAEYSLDKTLRGYGGISPQFLDILTPFLLNNRSMVIGKAMLDGCAIAGVLLICHGQSATYQIGVTTEQGRDVNAHHLLLWQGAAILKDKGISELDLGGVNDDTAEGIKRFKKGMGGEPYRLVGHYA